MQSIARASPAFCYKAGPGAIAWGTSPCSPESTILNIAAVILYFLIWSSYEILFDSRFRRSDSLNAKMVSVRNAWAARMLTRAIIGSAPLGRADQTHQHATTMAVVLGHAVASVNAGFRGYDFAFAAVGWIAHPLVLVLGAFFTVTVLARRQLYSPVAQAIRDYAGWLGSS